MSHTHVSYANIIKTTPGRSKLYEKLSIQSSDIPDSLSICYMNTKDDPPGFIFYFPFLTILFSGTVSSPLLAIRFLRSVSHDPLLARFLRFFSYDPFLTMWNVYTFCVS